MNRRLTLFFIAAFLPIAALALLFPERAFRTPPVPAPATATGADIVAFVSKDCPHCAAFKAFAASQEWQVELYDIANAESQALFRQLQEHVRELRQSVPTIVINGHVLQGYKDDATTGGRLKTLLMQYRTDKANGVTFDEFLSGSETAKLETAEGACDKGCSVDIGSYLLDVPILGEVDLALLSLPTLSVLLGFLDGFNPCAMWVLVTLLTLLIATRDPKKVWMIGGTFLFVSGAMYYLFIAAWLNAFLVIGFNAWIQKIIGLVAIGGGAFYFYEAFGKDPNACAVTDLKQKRKIMDRMKSILEKSAWPAMLLGVSILAVSVNAIELVCTAGLPAIFTQILAFNEVSALARYGAVGLYILLYMIDDVVIFAIAVYTLHATGLTKKYARFTLIFGGFLMYALGALLLFAPEVLTFA
ncbi:MAG: glutaredoxin domain-containing protein [Candidatus Peribacteraceae bacterium]|jgi:glutaredoxin|nr:glutaredoxin domain-containing protein [Candidatus Peribacteraceae bacterium]